MPRTLFSRTFLALWCAFVFGAIVCKMDVSDEPIVRQPASLEAEHSPLLQVAVRAPKGIARREDQETILTGYLRVDKQMPGDLRYKWDLPEGVTVISGRAQGYMREMRAGQVNEVQLTVTGFAQDELKLVSLYGYIVDGEQVQGRSAALTSRPRDSYEILNPKKVKAE